MGQDIEDWSTQSQPFIWLLDDFRKEIIKFSYAITSIKFVACIIVRRGDIVFWGLGVHISDEAVYLA